MEIDITLGQYADITQAESLLININPRAFLVDRFDNAEGLINPFIQRGIIPVIPPTSNKTTQ